MTETGIIVEMKMVDYGKLRAIADVTFPSSVGEITIRGFKVIQSDGEPWVAFPSSSYVKDGKRMNAPILEVSRGLRRQIIEAVMAEYEGAAR